MPAQTIKHVPGITTADSSELLKLGYIARRMPSWRNSVRANKSGHYLSLMRGRGMEYDESRQYIPGDDVRYLDSRTTARHGEAYTKIFREQRERPIFICVDDRASMHFATRGIFKRTIAAKTAALISWMAFYHGERMTALVFDEFQQKLIKSGRGRRTLMRILKQLGTNARMDHVDTALLTQSLSACMKKIHQYIRPGSILFIISDLHGLNDMHVTEIRYLSRYCDVIISHVSDPLEYQLPQHKGSYLLSNGSYQLTLYGGDPKLEMRFEDENKKNQEQINSLCKVIQTPLLELKTDSDPVGELRNYFRF